MKTPLQKEYTIKLANLNDQFCFFLFSREELNDKISNFSASVNPLFTTDLFNKNKYSSKIHVTLEKLPLFLEQNQTLNFGAYFSFSYEFLSSYIDDIMVTIEKINGVGLTSTEQKQDLETRLSCLIKKCGLGTPPQEIFDTISYLRLRRNYFTHVLETLNAKFLDIVTNKGQLLNTFWASSVSELDFTSSNVEEFKENETLDLLKLTRIILERIDSFVSGILNEDGIAELVTIELFETNPSRLNLDVIQKRISMVSSSAYNKYGIRLSNSIVEECVKRIGRK
ncbi:hypothetical protein [uncultured Pedobacter sp.]|uniref:hypothetical protein n=1 Tax=uncultured Pedobacter sp. TaxID=246139 RepID=UPI001B075E7E|nr:hypothetical protein [uncultured Pedobacter sp.]MBO9675125.1 hypothetical protein [Sphingobacteriaceae bacterium]